MIERGLGDGGNGQYAHVRANQNSWLEMKFKQGVHEDIWSSRVRRLGLRQFRAEGLSRFALRASPGSARWRAGSVMSALGPHPNQARCEPMLICIELLSQSQPEVFVT
jgi:hypothetical protein